MILFMLAFLIMVLAITGMSIGVVFGRRPLAGGCALACGLCSKPCARKKGVQDA